MRWPGWHRYRLLVLATASLAAVVLPATAQKPALATHPTQSDFLPAGPFLFKPGAIHPTYMDTSKSRPLVESPDGGAQITVTGPAESLKAWVTVQFLGENLKGLENRVWPVESSVDVLWRPDSHAFALTDNRYANLSYVLLFGTEFHMGETDPELGIAMTDLTPIVRKAFEEQAKKYYADQDYDTLLFYAKALSWHGYGQILIGVSARTEGSASLANRGIKDWAQGYLVDIPYSVELPDKKVVDELSQKQLLSQYGIKVASVEPE